MTVVHALLAIVQEALGDLKRSPGVNSISILTMAVSLALVGAFLLLATNLGSAIERWTGEVRVDVFIEDDAAPETIEALARELRAESVVVAVRRVSREEALAEFRAMFPDLAAVPEELGRNPFPASLRATVVRPPPPLEALAGLGERFAGKPGVEEVRYDQSWVEKLRSLVRLFAVGGAVVGGILVFAALFTMTSVIRLNVYARQEEIRLQRLVGATASFIRGPFVAQGMLQGLSAAAIALVVLYAGQSALVGSADAEGNALLLLAVGERLSPRAVLLLLGLGGGIGLLGSAAAVRRFLRL